MNSLEIYEYARSRASTLDSESHYLLLVTTTFYELVTARESPLISKFCRDHQFHFDSKNFIIDFTTDAKLKNPVAPMDMLIITYGLTFAFTSLDNCAKVYRTFGEKLFQNLDINDDENAKLTGNFKRLDECIGNFFDKAAPKVETQTETVRAVSDENFIAELNELASARTASDEKIIDDIKNLQLALQEELEAVRGSLKEISDLRDDIDFRTVREPIEQLLNLIDKLNATLAQHPNENESKGYAQLIKRCNSFSRYLLQTLGSLGAEVINPVGGEMINPDEHEVFGSASLQAKVVKVNRIGCRYKGRVIKKAEVEVEEPAGGNVQ